MFQNMQVVRYPMGLTTPANAESPYATVLQDCVFSNTRTASCNFGTLPLLGTQTRNPTIEQVMSRVLVSHTWMGTRFREVLEAMPSDMLLMMRGVTAVVISSDVRPSFFWTRTGAIYLDPEYIWLTPSERATIPTTPDFRSNFGADLQLAMPWRYVKDNAPAYVRYPYGQEQPRQIADIVVDIGRLLYHELAHANDYYVPERQASYTSNQTPLTAVVAPIVSDDLTSLMPLSSNEMRGLARVRFHGDNSTATQRGYTPLQVAGFFAPDTATVFYNYSTQREDLAMLFEILLMRFHFGAEMDTAVTNNPQGQNLTSADYIVAWGQRNRLGEHAVRERARYVSARLLPEVNLNLYVDTLPGPRQMRVGESWAGNMVLDPAPRSSEQHRHLDKESVEQWRQLPVDTLHGYH